MITIKTKNPSYTGTLSSIAFLNGVATVETLADDDKAWLESIGCVISVDEAVEDKKGKK